MTNRTTITEHQRHLVRLAANRGEYPGAEPVLVEEGAGPARFRGEGYHWTTKTGIRINHPGAYAKKGWSSMNYVCSTLHYTVGAETVKFLTDRNHRARMGRVRVATAGRIVERAL